jgi:hypothetical protein
VGGAVNDSENVGVSLRDRERANQINMDMRKLTGRNRDVGWQRCEVGMGFGSLACDAFPGPEFDVPGHVLPKESCGDEAAGGMDARVTEGMDVVENLFAKGKRDERTKGGAGNVTEERKVGSDGDGGDAEGGISLQLRDGGTKLLFLGNILIGKWKREQGLGHCGGEGNDRAG